MTSSGLIAVIVLVLTNAGTIIAAWVAVNNLRHARAKEDANRRIILERWADEINRYHHRIRDYLWKKVEEGVIDVTRMDISVFEPPPLPTINGNTQ